MQRPNHESRTDLYNKARAKLVEEAKTQPLHGPAHQQLKKIDAIHNAPSLYSDIGKVVKKVFGRKTKPQQESTVRPVSTPPVTPVVKDPGKPVDEKRTPTEPIDVVGPGHVEPLPLNSQLK